MRFHVKWNIDHRVKELTLKFNFFLCKEFSIGKASIEIFLWNKKILLTKQFQTNVNYYYFILEETFQNGQSFVLNRGAAPGAVPKLVFLNVKLFFKPTHAHRIMASKLFLLFACLVFFPWVETIICTKAVSTHYTPREDTQRILNAATFS